MIQFKGLIFPGGREECTLPGWTGSRGDILRALMSVVENRHRDLISVNFETRVTEVDVNSGMLSYSTVRNQNARQFDFIVGGDGAGSVVRRSMVDQVPGFTVVAAVLSQLPHNDWFDCVGDELDRNYLHGLAVRPFCVAGAIKGDEGGDSSRWFCAVGTKKKQSFNSIESARAFFRKRLPRVLELTSDEKVAAFAERTCYHIGQTLTCSQLFGGRAVLLGDAAAAFPPIGQGINAAMESAMTLDLCIGDTGSSPHELVKAAKLYNAQWKPEADAVSWMSTKSLFENRYHMLRALLASKLGVSIFDQAKSADIPYSEVRRKAKWIFPLWM